MFYVFDWPVVTANSEAAKKRLAMDLTVGVIHQVDVLFQDGCDHKVNVQIFQGNFQIWPSNRGATLKGNATVVSFREFYELRAGGTDLHASVWGDPAADYAEIVIQIGLLSKRVLQPLSFEELLAAATGVR